MFDDKLPDDVHSVHIGREATDPARVLYTVRLTHPDGGMGGITGTARTFGAAWADAQFNRYYLETVVPRETANV